MAAAVVLAPPPLAGVMSLHWDDGRRCALQVSPFAYRPRALVTARGPPPRPSVDLHRVLYIHRFLPDGRRYSVDVNHLPDSVHDASRLLSPSNAQAVIADMVLAMGYVGLPEAALREVAETVRLYVRDVAAWTQGCGAPPLSTQVRVTVHVSMTLEEEEEATGNNNNGEELGSPPTAAWSGTVDGAGDQLVGGDLGSTAGAESLVDDGDEEGKEEECCAICLDGMSRRRRRWLPGCSHGFHGDCLQRWLMQKAQCPLCRRPVEEEDDLA